LSAQVKQRELKMHLEEIKMAKSAKLKRKKLTPRLVQWYGWVPDLPDQRDKRYSAPEQVLKVLPPKVDLRAQCPPVYDQGQLGSCTANAIGAALQFNQMKQNETAFAPSRLFIYYNERVMEHSISEDAGAMIRDGIKSVATIGAPPEIPDWPYDIKQFKTKPPSNAYTDAKKYQALLYQRVDQQIDQLRGCLAAGFPFVFGITVYESFESAAVAKTGTVPMPKPSEKTLGGHAIMAVGYNDKLKRFIIRNSWGVDWGMEGYFTLPYAYLLESNLADDFWTIKLVK
jgi:C1A family cysteine protease